ncbi:MAG TPA: MaoC family dehydratase [Stellaceae bacterium]|nr:MaoC family dehydratase [Stellaceae bacterium]
MARHYFEDFRPGETIELGSRAVTEAEIIAFARDFDPQYFHTDPEAARRSIWGGLVASGWHTTALFMRLLVDGHLTSVESIASPGVDEIRWLKPVRPGDRLSGRLTILEATPSKSGKPRGTLLQRGELHNQNGELVMTLRAISIIGARPRDA